MFIGHYAVALAVKKTLPKTSLGTSFLASQLVDLLWPIFLLMGLEHVRIDPGNTAATPLDFYDYPITHSLMAAIFWSAIGGLVYNTFKHERRSSLLIGLCIFSHWILDLITHRPDLPLAFGKDIYFGLGLWNSLIGTIVVEIALFAGGILLYIRTTAAADKIGFYGFWGLISFLLIIYIANLFGPPPPDEFSIGVAGNASWLFVIWAYWIDRHRIGLQ